MKRALIVLGLAVVLVFGVVASAHAANPPGTYKLTVTVYFDADADACWDANEPVIPHAWIAFGAVVGMPGPAEFYKTNNCGYAVIYEPVGATRIARFVGADPESWDRFFGTTAWATEATPRYSATEYWFAKVVMNGNRCMLLGESPTAYVPPDCTCAPARCVRPD
jgi:hypothetical protein